MVSKTVINVRVVAILFINLFVHAVVTDRRHHGIVEAYPRLVVQAFSGLLAPTMLLDVCFQPWLRSTPGGVFREAVPHGEVERYYFYLLYQRWSFCLVAFHVRFMILCGRFCQISRNDEGHVMFMFKTGRQEKGRSRRAIRG